MHELAIAESIVDMVGETAAGRRVVKVIVEIGAESCVSREALAFSINLAAEGTAAENAMFEIRPVAGKALNLKSMEIEGTA
jgi:Zn finger protein HypA/HybF involved in hydrogenase expression